jgi:hypothetical protein
MRSHPGMKLMFQKCAVSAVAVFAASACASAGRSVGAECVAVVRNNTTRPVDAYTTGGVFLATVPPGSRVIPLQARTALLFRVSAESDPDRKFLGFGDRRSRGRVNYEMRCPSAQ